MLDGYGCEGDSDCRAGTCGPDGYCQGCLGLRQSCDPANNQCCQNDGQALCRTSFDFDSTNCCPSAGGTCSGNRDCCNGNACINGRCCLACSATTECCPGFECRNGRCRTNICRETREKCDANAPCCRDGSTSCQGGRCCTPPKAVCEEIPRAGDPCCGAKGLTTCGPNSTCCYEDSLFDRDCQSNNECCSGYCHKSVGNCCRTEGAECSKIGIGGFECCTYLGLTCGANGFCYPCRKLGEACVDSGSDSDCCMGSGCENGVLCTRSRCLGNGDQFCQEDSVRCPGHYCHADSGMYVQLCEAEGERGCFPPDNARSLAARA